MTSGLARRLPIWLLVGAGVLVGASSVWAYRTVTPLAGEFFRPSRLAVRGLVAYLRADYAAAGRLYRASFERRAIREYPEDPFGVDALVAGNLEMAGRRARLTLALVPGAMEPRVTLGEVAIERRQFEEALGLFDEVLGRRADHSDALYLSVIALARLGRHDEAIERLNRGLIRELVAERPLVVWRIVELIGDLAARAPQSRPLCLLSLLHRYLRIFDPRQADAVMGYATAAIEANDRPADAWVSIAIVRNKRGDRFGGFEAMQRAYALSPGLADVAVWLADDAGERDDVVNQYRLVLAAFEARPTDPYFLRYVDHVIAEYLGDAHTVVRLMERAIAIEPGYVPAHARLAVAAQRLGDSKRAASERAIVKELEAARRAREADE